MHTKHVDIIVVGAGVLGTFHAYYALKQNLRVLLIEKDQYPIQATVRNFGQIVPSGMSTAWFELGRRSTQIYSEIQQCADITVRKNGSVYLASDPDEVRLIHELKEKMDARKYPVEILSSKDRLSKWPVLNEKYCQEALFFPQEISVDPQKMIGRVLAYMIEAFPDLNYRPGSTVVECVTTAEGVQLRTGSGEIFAAEKIILCNGSEFKLLFPELFSNSGVVVSKLQMLRTLPMISVKLPGNILTGLTIRRYESFKECPSYTTTQTPSHLQELKKWGIHILFKQEADGSVILGDSHEYAAVNQLDSLGFSLNQHINELMLTEAQRIVSFDVKAIASSWAGFYAQHTDKDILELDIENKIHIRTAIGGKGMTSGPAYAEASIKSLLDLS